ncbi:hypothetical protein KAS50_09040 [bacterium]|nr:hypothetical protein [bacterium]
MNLQENINSLKNTQTRRSFLEKMSAVALLGTGILNINSKYNDEKTVTRDISQVDVSGTVDLHVHGNTRRKTYGQDLTALETARAMAEHGVKAWVDKDKRGYTWAIAEVVRRAVQGTLTLGSLVLDMEIGGINPAAVDAALAGSRIYAGGDARVIWMPSETYQIDKYVFMTGSNGNLLPEVNEVLKLVAESNVVLATGHLPYKHVINLVPKAKELGVEKIMITHPDWLDLEQQKSLCRYGVYFNRCIGTWSWQNKVDMKELKDNPVYFASLVKPSVENMRTVGIERNVISTDWGPHTFWDNPPLAMKPYIWSLIENGITENEIDTLVRKNPSYLAGV